MYILASMGTFSAVQIFTGNENHPKVNAASVNVIENHTIGQFGSQNSDQL